MKVVEIGQRNTAPSADDPEHDVHVFSIAIGSATPFWLEHSIRGGHAERGGCSMLALHELAPQTPRWTRCAAIARLNGATACAARSAPARASRAGRRSSV